VRLLIRTWNLFHGNAQPPERHAFLRQMLQLASRDEPDILCLQELPVWALPYLEKWSGMQAFGAVAQPSRLGPLPIPPRLGGALTSVNHGLFRSAVSGQAIGILLSRVAKALAHETLVLNTRSFRDAQSAWLRPGLLARLAWGKERRVVQAVRARFPGGQDVLVANLHTTSYPADQRLADAELLRAAVFADALAQPGDVLVLAGDFNVRSARSATLRDLSRPEWGFSAPAEEGIDQVLVRGARVERLERWPRDRRRVDGRVLSDHTPVDVTAA
jgi:endonuclease/exonuclease/phosphatase family metal-dependent hydrolase